GGTHRVLADYVDPAVSWGQRATILPGDVFYDLGSGTGKIPLQVALQTGVAMAKGVEFARARHEKAAEAYDRLRGKTVAQLAGEGWRGGGGGGTSHPPVQAAVTTAATTAPATAACATRVAWMRWRWRSTLSTRRRGCRPCTATSWSWTSTTRPSRSSTTPSLN